MWEKAHWILYDYAFHSVSRLETFRRLVKVGLSPREAAAFIQDYEREP